MLKKILFSLAAIFLAWQSYGILLLLNLSEFTSTWIILLYAVTINLFITGIFAFLGFAYPTQQLLSQRYYRIANSKRLKKIYNNLKVDVFQRLLLATFWKSSKLQGKFFDGKRSGINHMLIQTKKAEFGHLIPFILITLFSVWIAIRHHVGLAVCTMVINVILNLYPIILQRYHRMRIQVLEKRLNRKKM